MGLIVIKELAKIKGGRGRGGGGGVNAKMDPELE